MTEPLYGHDLLGLLLDQDGACGLEELRAAAAAAHGPEAIYHNCHGDSFDFNGVIAFLTAKGKVQVVDGQISLGLAPSCQH